MGMVSWACRFMEATVQAGGGLEVYCMGSARLQPGACMSQGGQPWVVLAGQGCS